MHLPISIRAAMLAVAVALPIATAAHAEPCPPGQAASNYEAWQWVANNAARTADAYATQRNPQAVFALAEATPFYQAGGQYKGQYLVQVLHEGKGGISLAMLKPNFPFCADPSGLDTERPDLFTVVSAKFNGRAF